VAEDARGHVHILVEPRNPYNKEWMATWHKICMSIKFRHSGKKKKTFVRNFRSSSEILQMPFELYIDIKL
jgi:hypothetical protein